MVSGVCHFGNERPAAAAVCPRYRQKAGDLGYTMAIPKDTRGAPPSSGSSVTVNDVDARVARVESLGGKICSAPRDIPNAGRFATIADPQGAMPAMTTYSSKE